MSLKEQAEALGIKVDGRWSDKRIQEEIDKVEAATQENEVVIHTVECAEPGLYSSVSAYTINDLAMRIWEGQSVSLPERVRVTRIINALKDKGYEDLSDLNLPVDMSRYI